MIIKELAKVNLNMRLDLTKTDYRNEGQAVVYHSNSFELKIYDKIKDLEQSNKSGEKRSLEKQNQYRPDLFNYTNYKTTLNGLQVLRIEGRFVRRKLKSLFNRLKISNKLTFKELFKKEVSKAILIDYFQQITTDLYILHFDLDKIDNLITTIRNQNPNIKPAKILQLLGFIQTVQSLGNRGTRVELYLPNHQWYRFQREVKEIKSSHKNYRFLAVCDIEKKLERFEPIRFDFGNK